MGYVKWQDFLYTKLPLIKIYVYKIHNYMNIQLRVQYQPAGNSDAEGFQ